MKYQALVGCSRRTAARDLDDLIDKGVIQRQGAERTAHYVLVSNLAINLPIVPSQEANESKIAAGKSRKDKKET